MAGRPTPTERSQDASPLLDGAFRLVVIGAIALAALTVVRLLADAGSQPAPVPSGAVPSAAVDVTAFLVDPPSAAPPLDLVGPDGGPISLAALHAGQPGPSLVFFGYTHCPDVCPATIGTVSEAIAASDSSTRALLVSIDPERDTVPWLAEFARYLPTGFSAATGTPSQVAATAAAWGVRYARVDTGDPAAYTMSHTADVFLIDAQSRLRAKFPFGTEATTMSAVLTAIEQTADDGPPASAVPSVVAVSDLWPEVVSSSVWAGGQSPIIVRLHDALGPVDDATWQVSVSVLGGDGQAVGRPSVAAAVTPSGLTEVSFVATLDIPAPGTWRLAVDALDATGATRHGTVDVVALDPGGSARIGGPAPTTPTRTATDVDGDLTWLTTDPLPDPRLSATSTSEALASGSPFVLVVDSAAFKVTPACGKALVLAKRLLDRWRTVPFIHHEPYRYDVITTEPVLIGTLDDPVLTDVAGAWGVGAAPWGVGSMPWVFIVDGDGVVRAKYQGVVGSADIDVILSLLASEA